MIDLPNLIEVDGHVVGGHCVVPILITLTLTTLKLDTVGCLQRN